MKRKSRSTFKLLALLLGVLALLGLGHAGLTNGGSAAVVVADEEPGLLITALHFDPVGEIETSEAFRLMNVGREALDLAGWSVTNGEGTIALTGTLEAGQVLWITAQAIDFSGAFGFAPDFEYASDSDLTPNLMLVGTLSLDNEGGQLVVQDATGNLVDAVVYSATMPQPDPPSPGDVSSGGVRLSVTDTLTTTNWVGPAIAPYTRSGFQGEGQVF